ncbi:hypothetical protein HMPREF9952_2262 [Haemophilus pittmaniae HK 85]|uniref:Uncharacterized protein n=1 Tax=Haemophilus pittmaniae HK 85 TaxID=1035188 RepID=F9Q6J7_9PAST|nr:hypothetical protein HMPREF9952_2262 [Haemophilus pittmaniae HK 85]
MQELICNKVKNSPHIRIAFRMREKSGRIPCTQFFSLFKEKQ